MIHKAIAPFRVRNRVQTAPALSVTSVERISRPPNRTVLTYGAFDGFHSGHALWLGQLMSLGSDLIVGCATDAFCDQIGRPSHASFDTRRAVLESCRYVSRVIPFDRWDQRLTDIVNHNISVLAVRTPLSSDLNALNDIVQVVHLPSNLTQTWASPIAKSA